MELSTLAAIGEFVGGIAVLVTIGYLAYQSTQTRRLLEQSTNQQAMAMLRANIDGWNHMHATILGDSNNLNVYYRMRTGDKTLEGDDLLRAHSLAMMHLLNLENVILQFQKVPWVDVTEAQIDLMMSYHIGAVLSSQALCKWWQKTGGGFTPLFRDKVDEVLRKADPKMDALGN